MQKYWLKAREYADACFSGKRWGGSATLIVVDAALTSSGLKYFTVVVPRVKEFERRWPEMNFEKLSGFIPEDPELLSLFNNPRVWSVAVEIARALNHPPKSDFENLRDWARGADLHNWKQDKIGKIRGVGLDTFQYLRVQAGVDASMPDRIIWNFVEKQVGRKIKGEFELMEECNKLARKTGVTQIELCWRIWLSESDKEP